MPVRGGVGLDELPGLIECLHYLLRQRTLLQVPQVTLKLLKTGDTNDDPVVTSLGSHLELRVVDHPAKAGLDHGQPVRCDSVLDELEGLEDGLTKVTFTVYFALTVRDGGEPALCRHIPGLDLASEQAT
jgi:hypothetical protein